MLPDADIDDLLITTVGDRDTVTPLVTAAADEESVLVVTTVLDKATVVLELHEEVESDVGLADLLEFV